MTSSTPDDATQLLRAVHDLAATVTEQTSALQLVAADTRANTVALEKQAAVQAKQGRRGWWNRFWIVVSGVGLILDLVLSVVVITSWQRVEHVVSRQDCQSKQRSALSVLADRDRQNVNDLLLAAISGKIRTPAQAKPVLDHFKAVVVADQAARDRIVNGKACR